jgi:hypothetical protein
VLAERPTKNPLGGGGFPSLFSSIIGFFEDLLGGGSSSPTPTAKESLGRRHKPMVILVGAEGDLGPNQLNLQHLPARTTQKIRSRMTRTGALSDAQSSH